MGSILHDLRHGARMLAKSPGFASIAVVTLALGIGATTAIFSVTYGVLLRPLPYPQPDRIVQVGVFYRDQPEYSGFNARESEFWKTHGEPFKNLAAQTGVGFNLTGGRESMRARALRVSSEYFQVLGGRPILGRDFAAEEDTPSGPNVTILSYGLWRSQFAGDTQLIGKSILLDGAAYTVIGVMPKGFQNIPAVDLWTTIAQVNSSIGSGANYSILGRLKDGVTREQASAYLELRKGVFFQEFRSNVSAKELAVVDFRAAPMGTMVASDYRTPLLVLFGAIGFVLLIACVNVANLLLARSSTRKRELAVRAALGAGRGRLLLQLLSESALLSIMGAALGLLLAYWGLNALLALAPTDLPRATEISLDRWALGFTAVVTVLSAIVFGSVPAWQASKVDLNESLKEVGERAGFGRQRLRSVLVVAEVALSLVLLTGASLLIETFANLVRTDPGFNRHSLLSVQIWPTGEKFTSLEAISNFIRELVRRIEAVPGVQSAAIVTAGLPLERGGNEYIEFLGTKQRDGISADYREVTPRYFRTLGVPLKKGRFFSDSDSSVSRRVAIINETMARDFYADRDPVGQLLKLENQDWEIVGVAGNVRSFLNEPAPPTIFVPDAQSPAGATELFLRWFPDCVLVRTGQDPLSVSKAVRDAIHSIDPTVPIGKTRSMDEVLSTSIAFQKFLMTLMSVFAGLAIVLAMVGIYGVMAYFVVQRTHEIGVRIALGALQSDGLVMVIGRGMLLTLTGILAGIAVAIGLTRVIAEQLYGVKPTDVSVFAIVVAGVTVVALLACWIPARRATKVDPIVALRYE